MSFFEYNGPLPSSAPSYVERPADRELLEALDRGELCFILTSRQMGKSSLLNHTRARLAAAGHHSVSLDLMAFGANVTLTPEQWYDGLLMQIGNQLRLSTALENYWFDHDRIGPVQRLFDALHDVVLPQLPPTPSGAPSSFTVFVDEIDTVRLLPFYADEFFAAIRECHNESASDPQLGRIRFCLSGVTTLDKLIRNTPFVMSIPIELDDFPLATADAFLPGLNRAPDTGHLLIQRIFDWTHGHPYLTQRFCQAVANDATVTDAPGIDALCRRIFLSPAARDQDPNLQFVEHSLLQPSPSRDKLLLAYDRIRHGQPLPDSEHDSTLCLLRLSGIVRLERGVLVVRNRIYSEAFDERWLRSQPTFIEPPDPRALAVLPFRDLSSEPDEKLTDGLTEDLIQSLGRIPKLRVLSRNSVFLFKGREDDPRQAGLKLGAALVYRGYIRRLASRVQVKADLFSTTENTIVWATVSHYPIEEWRTIREDLTRGARDYLRSKDDTTSPPPPTHHPTPNPQAYQLYLRGLHQWNLRGETPLKRSLICFEGALALDPRCAAAHTGVARSCVLLSIYNCLPPHLAHPRARAAALRAIELDDSLAEAHSALACTIAAYDRDFARAEHSFRKALSLNPSCVAAHQWFATMCLCPLGRHDEAITHLREAQFLDPLSPSLPASIAMALHFAGRPQEAIEQASLAIEIDENFWVPHLFLGWIHESASDFPKAIESLNLARSLSHDDPAVLGSLAHVLASAGDASAATALVDFLLSLQHSRYVAPAEIALVYLALQRFPETRKWLEKARQDHSYRLIYSRVDPRFLPARQHPDLAPLLT